MSGSSEPYQLEAGISSASIKEFSGGETLSSVPVMMRVGFVIFASRSYVPAQFPQASACLAIFSGEVLSFGIGNSCRKSDGFRMKQILFQFYIFIAKKCVVSF
jgi:hypothetical protein